MEKVKLGLIGCGGISRRHVDSYGDLHNRGLKVFDIKALCDISEEKAKVRFETISSFQADKPKIYTDLEDMLKEEDLDAVDICLPHHLHHSVATKCLEEGLHVIVEKPLGVTMRAARMMIETAEKHGKTLAVAENSRRSSKSRATRWAIEQGLIGNPQVLAFTATYWMPHPWGHWRDNRLMTGGSWILDTGIHFADYDRYHLGVEPLQVYGVVDTLMPVKKGVKVTIDDMAMALTEYENKIHVQWYWNSVAAGEPTPTTRVIYGSKGRIAGEYLQIQKEDSVEKYHLNTIEKKWRESIEPEELEKLFPKGTRDTFTIELYDFFDSIVNKRKPEVDGWEGYRDMSVIFGLYESAAIGEPVKIKDVQDLKVEEYQKEINEKLGELK
jgi:predicted dehydrogenase